MDIRHLQYVLEAARFKSFTKAADSLHITQPTISKTIRNLEDELGIEIFSRDGKRVELTDSGQIIVDHASHIMQSFDNLASELSELTQLKKGRIRIGLPPMAGASFFPGIISEFRKRYPGIKIEMAEDGAKKIEADVENGSLDVGVVLLPTKDEVFDWFSFVNENLKAVVHPSHPLSNNKRIMLSELADEPIISFRKDFALHDQIIAACVVAGFQPQVIYESSQWDFISQMVAEGLCIALLPETVCTMLDPKRVSTIELAEPAIPWQVAMIWRKEGYLSFAAREWIRFTSEKLNGTMKPRH